jgi:hypothetical protein
MKTKILAAVTFFMIMISACTSTHLTTSWKAPDTEISIEKLNKVLVVALFKTETSRREAEDEMANYLQGKGITSYNYLTDSFDPKNADALRDKIRAAGFDAAVTMRLIDVDKEKVYTPGNTSFPIYNRNFSGYYSRNWSSYSTPGYYSTTKIFTVETNIYSIKEDKIIWSGLTKTTDPDGVEKMMKEIVKVVYNKMLKEGFITM